MFSSNCCFLTSIQIPQEAGKVVWYSSLFKNFPQLVIHTVKRLQCSQWSRKCSCSVVSNSLQRYGLWAARLSTGFSRQEYWNGLPFPSPGDLLDLGIKLKSSALWADSTGFPRGSAGKESTCNGQDLGLIPGLGRSPGDGHGNPLQYSGLKNPMDCIVHAVTKGWTWLSDFHFTLVKQK